MGLLDREEIPEGAGRMITKICTAVFFIGIGLYFLGVHFPLQGILIGVSALILGILALL